MKYSTSIIFLVVLLDTSLEIQNELPSVDGCPSVRLMQERVLLDLMNGTWYEVAKDESSFRPGRCVTVDVSEVKAGYISIKYSQSFGSDAVLYKASMTRFNATMVRPYLWAASHKSLYSKFCFFLWSK